MFRSISALFLALAACSWVLMSGPAAAGTPPNVIVVLVDALRADHLEPYGYTLRHTSPNLARFATRAMVFDNVISQAGWTVPSVASIFTGVNPQVHQVLRYNQSSRVEMDSMSLDHDTIAEMFKKGGYSTAALLKSIVVDSGRGYSQGFDSFDVVNPKQNQADGDSARELTDRAISYLETAKTAGKPFYLYLHYMDPHSPYKAPEPFYSKYKNASYSGPVSGAHMQIENDYKKAGKMPSPADIEQMYALYDAEIEYWDSQFGRFMQTLVSSGMDPNTIVVVMADHGEAFCEHGLNLFHENLWQENIHVPFIIKAPNMKTGHAKNWAQNVDLAPTLAELTGLPKGKYWQGNSQVPVLKGQAAPVDVAYSEYADFRTVIDQSGKKLLTGVPGGPLLFDLSKDPGEKNNLAASLPDDVARLKKLMDEQVANDKALAPNFSVGAKTEMSDEQIKQLCALGYLTGDACK